MRILVCGDRKWTNVSSIRNAILEYTNGDMETVIIHGDARGADTIADRVGSEYGMKVVAFPALWSIYGKPAGPIRNQKMLDEGKPDLVLAFHGNIQESKGTKDMINRAKRSGIRVVLIEK